MGTLYDLFKVKEQATQEEIKEAYDKLLKKADSLPQSQKIIEQLQRIEIAYGILSNPEKRKRYDLDLATKRADELLEKVQQKQEKTIENEEIQKSSEPIEISQAQIEEERLKKEIENQIHYAMKSQTVKEVKENIDKQKEERQWQEEQLRKKVKKQEQKMRRQAKKEQQMKREMEINAYGEYLQKQGYQVKYPWTWLRIKRLMISIVAVILTFVIMWQIPFIRKMLTDLYEENFVIKFLVDTIWSLLAGVFNSIRSIFE